MFLGTSWPASYNLRQFILGDGVVGGGRRLQQGQGALGIGRAGFALQQHVGQIGLGGGQARFGGPLDTCPRPPLGSLAVPWPLRSIIATLRMAATSSSSIEDQIL